MIKCLGIIFCVECVEYIKSWSCCDQGKKNKFFQREGSFTPEAGSRYEWRKDTGFLGLGYSVRKSKSNAQYPIKRLLPHHYPINYWLPLVITYVGLAIHWKTNPWGRLNWASTVTTHDWPAILLVREHLMSNLVICNVGDEWCRWRFQMSVLRPGIVDGSLAHLYWYVLWLYLTRAAICCGN